MYNYRETRTKSKILNRTSSYQLMHGSVVWFLASSCLVVLEFKSFKERLQNTLCFSTQQHTLILDQRKHTILSSLCKVWYQNEALDLARLNLPHWRLTISHRGPAYFANSRLCLRSQLGQYGDRKKCSQIFGRNMTYKINVVQHSTCILYKVECV